MLGMHAKGLNLSLEEVQLEKLMKNGKIKLEMLRNSRWNFPASAEKE